MSCPYSVTSLGEGGGQAFFSSKVKKKTGCDDFDHGDVRTVGNTCIPGSFFHNASARVYVCVFRIKIDKKSGSCQLLCYETKQMNFRQHLDIPHGLCQELNSINLGYSSSDEKYREAL